MSVYALAEQKNSVSPGNFGLPGMLDLPIAKQFPDGELVFTNLNHKHLLLNGVSFQALPWMSFAFRYSGQGRGGNYAQGRINWDRSFDAHIALSSESKYLPAISLGLRDFIGTGWYSSEYIVGTKQLGNLELTAGLGFGRLAGRNAFANPLGSISSRFKVRAKNEDGRGGTFGTINWFQGDTSLFYGAQYKITDRITLSSEYSTDFMSREDQYLDIKSPWNWGAAYEFNDYFRLSGQYLYGSQVSVKADIKLNPKRPPLTGGKELAPVPMRIRNSDTYPVNETNEEVIRKVLAADQFKVHKLKSERNEISIVVSNRKFRSTAQSLGRIGSTLQRFTSDKIQIGKVFFESDGIQTAAYKIDLDQITHEQFDQTPQKDGQNSIKPIDEIESFNLDNTKELAWGISPYFAQRLFNPDLPLSLETGFQFSGSYNLAKGFKLSTALRKSVLTNFTKNKRRSDSVLPRVRSDWPLYDINGQNGHIHALKMSYIKNFGPGLYGYAHAGLLEPFFAGIGGEILFKPANWPLGIGIDIHHVHKRDYDMRFSLLDYKANIGHVTFYYDTGNMFNVEVSMGRYLAGDWGATVDVSRSFGSGWEIGGYITLTDVPFNTFGEGSFDKAIYLSIPIDWIISSPNKARRRLNLRPITRDGGANLANARNLYKLVERSQNSSFQREFGRLWR